MARGKQAEKGEGEAPKDVKPSVSAHPRARRSIARTKARAALLAFALVAFFSYRAGVAEFEIGLRALVAGIAAYLLVWALAVALWQRLIVHELKLGHERRVAEIEAHNERMRAQAEEAAEDDEEVVA